VFVTPSKPVLHLPSLNITNYLSPKKKTSTNKFIKLIEYESRNLSENKPTPIQSRVQLPKELAPIP
jgi:hypothetical protein